MQYYLNNIDVGKKKNFTQVIIRKEEDPVKWLNHILNLAEIIDRRYPVKGTFVWLGYGFQLMQNIKSFWDSIFKLENITEMHFPILIPIDYFQIDKKFFEEFKEQVFWVHKFGDEKPKYILKPTGEPAIYPMFSMWIKTHSDLPLRIYQNVPSYRHDGNDTQLLIRNREITFWYEIHTAHDTKEGAEKEVQKIIDLKKKIWKNIAVEPLLVEKPEWDCFPGIVSDYKFYHLLPNGRVLENGSCTNLGQTHALSYQIKFRKRDGTKDFVWQTNAGNGDRFLVAALITHGDEKGLVLPPTVSTIQVIVIPIPSKNNRDKIEEYGIKIAENLKTMGLRVHVDLSELTIGKKYNRWEIKGIPLRIEVGQIELENNQVTFVRRDNDAKIIVRLEEIQTYTRNILDSIQYNLYDKSSRYLEEHIKEIKIIGELQKIIEEKNIGSALWCGTRHCSDKMMENMTNVKFLGSRPVNPGMCIICKKESNKIAYFARTC